MLKISDLRHRVYLCTQRDVVKDGCISVDRHSVMCVRAKVVEKQKYSKTSQGFVDDGAKQTHEIMFRYDPNVVLTNYSWIYEERRKSQPRWFKVLEQGMTEGSGSRYRCLKCQLYEENDETPAPKGLDLAEPMPEGFSLG